MTALLLLGLLGATPALADEAGCERCCQASGLGECEARLRVVGDDSIVVARMAGDFEVVGLWVIPCEGTAFFDVGETARFADAPVTGEVATVDAPKAMLRCFLETCALPQGTCPEAVNGAPVLRRCADHVAVTDADLARPSGAAPRNDGATTVIVGGKAVMAVRTESTAAPRGATAQTQTAPTPSYAQPQQGAAQAAYTQPQQAATQQGYTQPQQAATQQAYAQPQQGYTQPQQAVTPQGYTQPQQAATPQSYAQPQQGYTQPQQAATPQSYAQPQQGYTQPQQAATPQSYAQPQQGYTQPQQGYTQPQPTYAQPQQGYAQPQQPYTAPPAAAPAKPKLDLSPPPAPGESCSTPASLIAESRRHVDLGNEAEIAQDAQTAADEYRAAITMDACNAFAWASLGSLALREGQPDEAVKALRVALRLRPEHYGAATDLGTAYERLGQTDRAVEAYRAALAAKPEHAPAKQGLSRLGAAPR
ncbi:MAG: tetratricopeptide repeat protein [Alphaproteobacteria bacterium]|nr:tetratricopeptide repeat protein [Alphaproteobacteria bacterium]